MTRDETIALYRDYRAGGVALDNRIAGSGDGDSVLDFSSAVFENDFALAHLTTIERATFEHMAVTGHAIFDDVSFHAICLDHAELRGGISFWKAELGGPGDATFRAARLVDAVFDRSRFGAQALFDEARFEGATRFSEAWFLGASSFRGATFSGTLDLDATFENDARFDACMFLGDTHFDPEESEGARFRRNVSFRDAVFFRPIRLVDGMFGGEADFSGATFADRADFSGVRFTGGVRFDHAVFEGACDFGGSNVPRSALETTTFRRGPPSF